jgi:serine/threonine protein kinase
MASSVIDVCNALVQSGLHPLTDVQLLRQLWVREARDPDDLNKFCRWLVGKNYLTEYQMKLVLSGHISNFFLNDYKILDRIGTGRMAGVYEAVHQFGQKVAIKVLPPSKAKDPLQLTRFKREARLALRLKHPNVVRTFQAGRTGGLYYIVMEYLDGETLEEVLHRRKSLPPTEAVRLVYQALQGLQHIHEQDMVHRDLKPGNLMLVPAAAPGQPDNTLHACVKLLDIGLGRALFDEGATEEDFDLTRRNELLGTPLYMAPEQARDAHRADIRADIYTLGCVLYHALTGQPPFVASSLGDLFIAHAAKTPAPMQSIHGPIPERLQDVVAKMLAKDPAMRYATPIMAGRALHGALTEFKEAPPVPDEDPSMRSYLQWLESQANEKDLDEEETTAPPRIGTVAFGTEAPSRFVAEKPEPPPTPEKNLGWSGPTPPVPRTVAMSPPDHASQASLAQGPIEPEDFLDRVRRQALKARAQTGEVPTPTRPESAPEIRPPTKREPIAPEPIRKPMRPEPVFVEPEERASSQMDVDPGVASGERRLSSLSNRDLYLIAIGIAIGAGWVLLVWGICWYLFSRSRPL